jgi:hypothetical protein
MGDLGYDRIKKRFIDGGFVVGSDIESGGESRWHYGKRGSEFDERQNIPSRI